MDYLRIEGGHSLQGTLTLSGSKNAALPLMVLTLLTSKPVVLHNVPSLGDIHTLGHLLHHLGTQVEFDEENHILRLHTPDITSHTAPYEIVRKMRASFLVLGPLLGRMGQAKVSLPGGCAIGARPVDFHIQGLQALGADIQLHQGYVEAKTKKGLKGGHYIFPKPSVTGSQNLLMAATISQGTTYLEGIAQEPEVLEMIKALERMGASITHDQGNVTIVGTPNLKGLTYTVPVDRIEGGTYMVAAALTRGRLTLPHPQIRPQLSALEQVLKQADVSITYDAKGCHIQGPDRPRAFQVMTQEYPGFPTDLQAQIMVLGAVAQGTSVITETIYDNRFMHVPELCRMNASIMIQRQTATIVGQDVLYGAEVMATDLRASVSLVLAALRAKGTTCVRRIYHLDRGYDRLVQKLTACGAKIQRLTS